MKIQRPELHLKARLRASMIHLLVSMAVAAAAAALVFGLWYPWPYRANFGGQGLFILVVSVDLILGPLLTLAIFDPSKGWPHLRRDLAVIACLQMAGLAYGIHTVYMVRPIAMVFEVDRFRVIKVADIRPEELAAAPEAYRQLPITRPWLLSTRVPRDAEERKDALFKGLEGNDIGARPSFWQPYEQAKDAVVQRSRPLGDLTKHYANRKSEIEAILHKLNLPEQEARFLPILAREDWIAILNAKGDVVGFAPFDGFF